MAANSSGFFREAETDPPLPAHPARHHQERDAGVGAAVRPLQVEGDPCSAEHVRKERSTYERHDLVILVFTFFYFPFVAIFISALLLPSLCSSSTDCVSHRGKGEGTSSYRPSATCC